MKRFIAMLLAMCMVLSLAACSQPEPDPTDGPTQATEPTDTTDSTESTEGTGGSAAADLDLPALEEGYNRVIFFWDYDGDISMADFWIWRIGKDGKGYTLTECEYGSYCYIDVPEGDTQVGFIPRYNCSDPGTSSWGSATKDVDADRIAVINGKETLVYLIFGDGNVYYSNDGGANLEVKKEFSIAGITSLNTIYYSIKPKTTINSLDEIKVYEGDAKTGRELEIADLNSLGKNSATGTITLAEELDLSKVYTVVINEYEPEAAVPTDVFDSAGFIEKYCYDGNDLGAVINSDGSTTFKLWAPTASKVVLNLFTAGDGVAAHANLEMTKVDKGVWELNVPNCGHGTYYTYSVTTSVGTQEAVDPYAVACGVNGDRGMVVDLDSTDPAGWNDSKVVTLDAYTKATIWEVHVRDFSNAVADSAYPGKYLAFTEHGWKNSSGVTIGVDYLLNLGVTHIHLQPIYDYASVDETTSNAFNWGYDPENYNCLEGSYSTDPFNGEVRINEFKQMVQSLHKDGLGVIMDVVYNHTFTANSNLNKVVPYYYYRYNPDGTNTSSSGCGNDTASERYMYRKYMVDSVAFWASEYKLDGFRFDLMGLHDVETMQAVEQAIHAVNPDAIIYGEAWDMAGSTVDVPMMTQPNAGKVTASEGAAGSVSVFSDTIRDGLKGSVFEATGKGYINGAYKSTATQVKFGISGGETGGTNWKAVNGAVINYMSCHDNLTLWDKLAVSNPDNTVEERLAMNRMGITIIMVSKGTPFFLAGEEMLRSKDGNENSYNASDAINNMRWDELVPGSDAYAMMEYYKGLIEMREVYDIFSAESGVTINFYGTAAGCMVVKYLGENGKEAMVLINPTEADDVYNLNTEWNLVCDGVQAGSEVLETVSGNVTIPAGGILVFVK